MREQMPPGSLSDSDRRDFVRLLSVTMAALNDGMLLHEFAMLHFDLYLIAGYFQEVVNLLEHLKKDPTVQPDKFAYRLASAALANMGDAEKSEQVYKDSVAAGCARNVTTTTTVMKPYAERGDLEKVQQLYRETFVNG